MRKILLLLLAFVSLTLTLKAQTQSLEDMKLQLEQTDTLYEAEKYDEVLEICLSIGRSTERCDSEQERTVYVGSTNLRQVFDNQEINMKNICSVQIK